MTRCIAMAVLTVSLLLSGKFAAAQPEEGVYYRIKNVNSKKMLALGIGAAKVDEAQIVQRARGEDERQQWKFVKVGKYFKIINRKSEQELNVRSKDEEAPIVASTDGKNAQWSLEKEGKAYLIKSRNSGLVVDVADESKDRKAPVIQYRNHEGRNQLFELEPVTE